MSVVYLLIPTSNHNHCDAYNVRLEVVYLLIPTSNHNFIWCKGSAYFVVYLLIPTSNHNASTKHISPSLLFISWFLHQTTTFCQSPPARSRCLSLDSYIKPQLALLLLFAASVVYLLIPTSNHNVPSQREWNSCVVYLLIPTSNHNLIKDLEIWTKLFISWFLHQTTTIGIPRFHFIGCLSLDSYIKPQQVSHIIDELKSCLSLDSYIKPQPDIRKSFRRTVVYLLIPTSNHNWRWGVVGSALLFISWFLHQTTTHSRECKCPSSCLSLDSYIKPQRCTRWQHPDDVVYLLIPTSNHNLGTVASHEQLVVYLLIPTSNHNSWVFYYFEKKLWRTRQTLWSRPCRC